MEKKITVQFWGIRGTLPVPGKNTLHYGGNTNCVTVKIPNKPWLIFDAGSGLKNLSTYLINTNQLIKAKMFISHPHWDHINTLPYFTPFYMPGNEFEIFCGCDENTDIEQLLFSQMDSVHFPVTVEKFLAKITLKNVIQKTFYSDGICIHTMRLNHSGICLGYRIEYEGKSFCYITDNELFLPDSSNYKQSYIDELINFIKDTNILIIDCTYTDEMYLQKITWGHSSVSQVVDIADKANVQLLCLYHHDPSQLDKDIDEKLKKAQNLLSLRHSSTICIAPKEGDQFNF